MDLKNLSSLHHQQVDFLKKLMVKYRFTPKSLWYNQMANSWVERWDRALESNKNFQKFEASGGSPNGGLTVLDLGCGFGLYWPLLMKLGFNNFVGIDMFDSRIRILEGGLTRIERFITAVSELRPRKALRAIVDHTPGENYLDAAHDVIQHFCPNIDYQLIEDDIRHINRYIQPSQKFDLVLAFGVDYQKMGATGIPLTLFDQVATKYVASNGFKLYA